MSVANILIRSEKVTETCKAYAKTCVSTLDVSGFIVLINALAKDAPKIRKYIACLPMQQRQICKALSCCFQSDSEIEAYKFNFSLIK